MSTVGLMPGMQRNRAIKSPINPMDKSTVFSIYPKSIRQVHYTCQPGIFEVPAGTYDEPARLVVGSSSWWKETDPEAPILEIPNGSVQVAKSIVEDYCKGLLGFGNKSKPGLFWLPGDITIVELRVKYKDALELAKTQQLAYYAVLLKMADGYWARTNGNPLGISDDMRLAAKEMNVHKEKDWMINFNAFEKVNCKACGAPKDPKYPVCQTCKAIDNPELAKSLGISFAQ